MTRALGGVLVLCCVLLGVGCGSDDSDGGTSDACREGCEMTLAADCENGPATQAQCESDCEALSSGACKGEYALLQDCAQGKTVTCTSAGLPTVSECSSEGSAFIACLN